MARPQLRATLAPRKLAISATVAMPRPKELAESMGQTTSMDYTYGPMVANYCKRMVESPKQNGQKPPINCRISQPSTV